MVDLAYSFAAWWGVLLVILVGLRLNMPLTVRPIWLAAAAGTFLIYTGAITIGSSLLPFAELFGPLKWNWAGKITAIVATLAMLAVLLRVRPDLTRQEIGLTLAQAPGSLRPSFIMFVLLLGFALSIELLMGGGPETDFESIAYQATMPGLDEELYFRSLQLSLFSLAIVGRSFTVAGATIGIGGLFMTLLFGLGHGLAFQQGEWMFDGLVVAVTGLIALGLLWIRERTGSIVMPILAHNAINLALSFV